MAANLLLTGLHAELLGESVLRPVHRLPEPEDEEGAETRDPTPNGGHHSKNKRVWRSSYSVTVLISSCSAHFIDLYRIHFVDRFAQEPSDPV